jgi:hypothetical protein
MDALAVRLALAAERQASAAYMPQVSPEGAPYLYILDGGNRFDLHAIARGVYAGGMYAGANQTTQGSQRVQAILQRIQVARAFTCYQVETLLAAAADGPGGFALAASQPAPVLAPPVLAPRLLTTFADGAFGDGDAPPRERLRLLGRCIEHLKSLRRRAPVLVSAVPPPDPQTAELLARLEAAADQVWRFEQPGALAQAAPPTPTQLRLFGERPIAGGVSAGSQAVVETGGLDRVLVGATG